jgi:hypothetical protein
VMIAVTRSHLRMISSTCWIRPKLQPLFRLFRQVKVSKPVPVNLKMVLATLLFRSSQVCCPHVQNRMLTIEELLLCSSQICFNYACVFASLSSIFNLGLPSMPEFHWWSNLVKSKCGLKTAFCSF